MASKDKQVCNCTRGMGFWDWAHEHPVALTLIVIFAMAGLVSIIEAIFR